MSAPKTYTLKSKNQIELEISSLGATIMSLKVRDKRGELVNVVVGLSKASDYMTEGYLKYGIYLGSIIGRHAGRISGGGVEIDGKKYPIYTENGVHLHGGNDGFDKKIWQVESIESGEDSSITLLYMSEHLEEGYPGNLNISVTYSLTHEGELKISYKATTDQTTVLNVTNHAYFNLDGESTILDHELELKSDAYLELGDDLIPTGKYNLLKGTPYDFLNRSVIGKTGFSGLDDIFVLTEGKEKAILTSKKSGIQMEVDTDQPAMVIYTPPKFANLPFKDAAVYSDYPAICFEAQGFPDALNNSHFPQTLLKPGETFESETIFRFSNI
ncbi:MAG: galactose mutarotase [Flavobacteriales bacterium]|nr:galactose mutarotase [Flavobacteriales bacterium]